MSLTPSFFYFHHPTTNSRIMSTYPIIIKTLAGLESVLMDEIQLLGGKNCEILTRAVKCEGDDEFLYKANLWLRTALSILKPLKEVTVHTEQELYKQVKSVDWHKIFGLDKTFSIDAVASGTTFTHSKYVALKSKDAIVDSYRERYGERPNVNPKAADIRINIHIRGDVLTISLDSTGQTLDKRGYRLQRTEAPINEVLAAGLLKLARWDSSIPFVDPMCGSGTIAIEAAMMALNIAPGIDREFCFQHWKDYDEKLWQKIAAEANIEHDEDQISPQICAFDSDPNAIEITKANARRAGVDHVIVCEEQDFFQSEKPYATGTLITNPPYGVRLREDELNDFYKIIGDTFKNSYNGFIAWVIGQNDEAIKHVGLRAMKRYKVFNGALECRFHGFRMFRGKMNG